MGGGRDVDGVARSGEAVFVEVAARGGFADHIGVVDGEDPGGSGEDRGALAGIGVDDPDQHVIGDSGVVRLERFSGGVEVSPQHPAQDLSDRLAAQAGSVQERGEQRG